MAPDGSLLGNSDELRTSQLPSSGKLPGVALQRFWDALMPRRL
jgi:hypothetical protein